MEVQSGLNSYLRVSSTSDMVSPNTTDLPPVVVTAPSTVSGSYSGVYITFMGGGGGSGPGPVDDHEQPIGPEDPPPPVDSKTFLDGHPQFEKLTQQMQAWVLQSEKATNQFADFLKSGGQIVLADRGAYSARYDPNSNTIILDKGTMERLVAGVGGHPQAEGLMFFAFAHELGHAVLAATSAYPFNPYGNEIDWAEFRSKNEALSNANAMLIANELQAADPSIQIPFSGYGGDQALRPLWNAFLIDHDFDSLINAMSDMVSNYPWPGGVDLNGDGFINQIDRYIEEFRAPRP